MALDEQTWRGVVSGERRGLAAALVRPTLRGLSLPYAAATAARRGLYARGILKARRADVPVISVGNLTAGGTGKTPLVAYVVRLLQQAGRRPAILSRGYKAVDGAADEPELLRRLTRAPVVVNPDRLAGAAEAVRQGADVCVLDDGFQHVRLRRDLDIVTIDATCPFGYGAVLPRGLLREPLAALRRADVLVLTRCDQAEAMQCEAVRDRLAALAPQAPLARSVMRPAKVCGFDGQCEAPESLAGAAVWAFCGLGRPEAFYRTLDQLHVRRLGVTSFNDHHAYTGADVDRLRAHAERAGARRLITTAKDAVKLTALVPPRPLPEDVTLAWLEVEVELLDGQQTLHERILQAAGH